MPDNKYSVNGRLSSLENALTGIKQEIEQLRAHQNAEDVTGGVEAM